MIKISCKKTPDKKLCHLLSAVFNVPKNNKSLMARFYHTMFVNHHKPILQVIKKPPAFFAVAIGEQMGQVAMNRGLAVL